jgi:cell division protein FtsB
VANRAWRALPVATFVALVFGLTACGGGGESGSEELARQHEIAAARQQAAQDARQAERVKQLQREVKTLKRHSEAGAATTTAPAAAPEPSGSLGDWPGGSGYTAILASLSTESEARADQRQATAAGLDAGVLFSSDFRSLRPGYWVVFSGDFGSVGEAEERVERAQELGYSDAYPRFVSP